MSQTEFPLHNLEMVLVKSRFPENIGMIARACANMGAGGITLVQPELWNAEKARPLATAKGQHLLESIRLESDLRDAVAPYALVVGTTARTGGWRKQLLHPSQAAQEIVAALQEGERVALMMGPEDRGLNNEEIECCQRLVTIPTAHAASLNVAQASLILLYECFKATHVSKGGVNSLPMQEMVPRDLPGQSGQPEQLGQSEQATQVGQLTSGNVPCVVENQESAISSKVDKRVTAADEARLLENLKESLVAIDFLPKDNPDYFFMPLRRFFGRAGLRRHEYDAFMGLCRQIKNKCL